MGERRRAGGRSRVDWDLLQNLVLVACLVVGVGFTLATTGGDEAPLVVHRLAPPHPPLPEADPTTLAGPTAAPAPATAPLEGVAPAAGPRRTAEGAPAPGFAIGDYWAIGVPDAPAAGPVPLAPALVDRFVTLSGSAPDTGARAPAP